MSGSLSFSSSASCDFYCMWKIPKFSSCCCETNKYIVSESFQPQQDSPEFCVKIYPGGNSNEDKGFISVFINRSKIVDGYVCTRKGKSFCDVSLNYKLLLRNSADEVLWKSDVSTMYVSKPGEGLGFPKTIKRDELINDLIDDVLIVCVNGTYCTTCLSDYTGIKYSTERNPKQKLLENYGSLLTNQENTDTVLSVGQETIPVHSLILSTQSEVFRAMFQSDVKDENSKIVEIADFEKEIIDCMIEFIYTGNIKAITFGIAMRLLRAADKYQLDHLKQYCSNYLLPQMNDGNVAQILMNADTHNVAKLRAEAIGYFRLRNGKEILKEHRPELKNYPEVLLDILDAISETVK